MKYDFNGKTINIPDKELEQLKPLCESLEECIELWLDDNGYTENVEQNALDEVAKKVKINLGARADEPTKEKKPRTVKISDEKQELFNFILESFKQFEYDIEVLKENKLFQIKVGEKIFKLDLIEQRIKK